MQPPEQVALVLREARIRGWPFDAAWKAAVRSIPRAPRIQRDDSRDVRRRKAREIVAEAEWREVLWWSRPFYAAAYAGQPLDADLLAKPEPDTGVAAA